MKSRSKLVTLLTQKYSNQVSKIDFQEDTSSGYASRTLKNASADATIAIAIDYSTAGEVLTKKCVDEQQKQYIYVPVSSILRQRDTFLLSQAIHDLNNCNAKTLNIAGNGLYTMKGKYTQQNADAMTLDFLTYIMSSPRLKNKIELIRSGGQTGFDEAGIKAAVKLGIPAMILAPQGWLFRDADGNDIRDEQAFKNRFNTI
jgi:hypothetical protein